VVVVVVVVVVLFACRSSSYQILVSDCCGARGRYADMSQREDESRPEGYDDQPDAGVRGDDDDGVDEAIAGVNGLAVDANA
jgi:hypothetical protein